MVDEDPHEGTMPHYFASLKELKKNDFRIQLVDAQKDNLVLVLRPDFERWFLSFCQREKIELKGISPKPSLFKGDIARPSGKKKFTQIVQDHLGHQTLVEIKEILS
ncbi:MAG TPA: hypothetical protein DCE41_27055 [Cytophagales bacterium]|nr:hypothetical protein [Cytophagales bacterium]HAA22632.1 hypothetical protein [Cytophagales bacterium]HAP61111.1 hypothetical protein [Cytophagales bacterium]